MVSRDRYLESLRFFCFMEELIKITEKGVLWDVSDMLDKHDITIEELRLHNVDITDYGIIDEPNFIKATLYFTIRTQAYMMCNVLGVELPYLFEFRYFNGIYYLSLNKFLDFHDTTDLRFYVIMGSAHTSRIEILFEDDYGYWISHIAIEALISVIKGKYIEESRLDKNIKSDFKTYLILNNRNKYVKIGKSLNVLKRERTLQSEEPDLTLIYYTDEDVETELHREYKHKRLRGEWFNLSEKDIDDIVINYNLNKSERN